MTATDRPPLRGQPGAHTEPLDGRECPRCGRRFFEGDPVYDAPPAQPGEVRTDRCPDCGIPVFTVRFLLTRCVRWWNPLTWFRYEIEKETRIELEDPR